MATMRFPDDVNDDVHKRLRRLEGQIRGLQRMLDEGAECKDVVTQLAACKGALDRVGYRLFAAGLRYCVIDEDSDMSPEELEKLFLKVS